MGDDEDSADPSSFVERALIETHHLANLTGTEEAKQARRRLVDAQSASRVTKTRDLLREAVEYLELARMDRRDAAKGFEKARMLAIRAETALGGEGRIQNRSIDRLFEPSKWSTDRETLLDLAEHEAVDSYEQLKYEMVMEGVFEELRGEVDDPELPVDDEPPRRDLSAEAALSLAAEELSDDDDPADEEGFVFVDAESLASTGE